MAIDTTATNAYAGNRFAPRTSGRTCAQGSHAQQRFIADLTRDIHNTRVAQVRAAHSAHGDTARWTEDTVRELLASMGTVEDAIARQMGAPLVYGDTGTINTLKLTLQRERAQLRAQTPQTSVAGPSVAVAGSVVLQEDKTYRAPDGRIFRVVRGGSGYLYGKLWVSTGHREGYWDYYQGIRRVEGLQLLTLEEAQAFGQLTGQCSECQTRLEDPVSIVLGIGPTCESKFTGKARSRGKAFRAEVLARANADQVAQMRPEDRPHTEEDMRAEMLAADPEPAPF